MPLIINLRQLEHKDLSLEGELSPADLEMEKVDELIHVSNPLRYKLEAQRIGLDLLVQGSIALTLECECARCLKPFQRDISFPDWSCHLPLEGEEKAEVVNDTVDLTPYIREDILLAFPQHPLCEEGCGGLKNPAAIGAKRSNGVKQTGETSSAWAELNKLKL